MRALKENVGNAGDQKSNLNRECEKAQKKLSSFNIEAENQAIKVRDSFFLCRMCSYSLLQDLEMTLTQKNNSLKLKLSHQQGRRQRKNDQSTKAYRNTSSFVSAASLQSLNSTDSQTTTEAYQSSVPSKKQQRKNPLSSSTKRVRFENVPSLLQKQQKSKPDKSTSRKKTAKLARYNLDISFDDTDDDSIDSVESISQIPYDTYEQFMER